MNIIFWIGGFCILLSVGCYARVAWLGRSSLKPLPWIDRLAALVSHLPDDSSKAWPHVSGGVIGCTGLALLLAAASDSFAVLGYHLVLEISNLIFALLVACIAFWTLWQTKRIEQNQAVEMFGFEGLITQLTKEIEALATDVFAQPEGRFPRFRVLLITKNPYFGQLSYPGEKITIHFKNAMRTASELARSQSMRLKILCCDELALQIFHEAYYKAERVPADKAKIATRECLNFINELTGANLHQVRRVPNIQFAVIGNVVLEFIIDSDAGQTDIQRYKRTNEKIIADRYEAFFEELTQVYMENGRGSEISDASQSTSAEDHTNVEKKILSTPTSPDGSPSHSSSVPSVPITGTD